MPMFQLWGIVLGGVSPNHVLLKYKMTFLLLSMSCSKLIPFYLANYVEHTS
ncbi:hypothetical protein VIBNIENn2_320073 [Vibrio nigripulchritudo ENn2]|nr:hypothetical protein VIBNIMADA3021_1100025 [Vibrio nigripulchritudo MADA3021]CCN93921.1 hypothetical protein VIBNIENn2_320073 [Vibrio nigripulchritudo ENn2]